jgi:patatin-like phospholipase/acyl hydrolase
LFRQASQLAVGGARQAKPSAKIVLSAVANAHLRMNRLVKILAIDGGGIRGIIPATLLAHIENLTGRPTAGLFDLIAGTSTGGILALGLTIPKTAGSPLYTAQTFVEMYQREGPKIFSRSLWRRIVACNNLTEEKYCAAGIDAVLADYFGDSRLADAATDVLVTSYEIEHSFPFFFKSSHARQWPDYDFPARQVARATSAAPTYFEPMTLPAGTNADYYTLIDGGVFANNPAACALVEAKTTHPEAGGFLVVSLGTGAMNLSLSYRETKTWGVARWAPSLLNIVFDGVSSTVDYQLRQLLPTAAGECQRYYRFQTTLDDATRALDNTSTANITALKGLAAALIEKESENLEKLCKKLAE